MRQAICCLFVSLLTACGGGGGSGLTCKNETPLFCPNSEGCCRAGLPYSCDGLCYSVPVGPCVESDFCTFNVKGLVANIGDDIQGDPALAGEAMSSPE